VLSCHVPGRSIDGPQLQLSAQPAAPEPAQMKCATAPTRDYVARRTAEGKTKTEIPRRLQRYVAREACPCLRAPAASIGSMAAWDDLKIVLARLADQDPRPLTQWPEPQSEDQRPPFQIGLAAWATAAAEELHQRFGRDAALTVGALRYPQRVPSRPAGQPGRTPLPVIDPAEARAGLDGALSIRSGFTAHHGLLVTNLTSRDLLISSSGTLIAEVVDPATGAVVGGYSGFVFAMRRTFTVAPAQTARIPLLVATDSFVPELGYAVPPGQWGIQATLDPAAGHAGRTPILPLTITI